MFPVGNQVPHGFCALSARAGQQQNSSGPVPVVDQRNQGERFSGSKSASGGQILRLFMPAGLHILYDFLIQLLVEDKSEIHLILKQLGPGIRTGASNQDDVVVIL